MNTLKTIWLFTHILLGAVLVAMSSCKKDEEDKAVKDIDGNIYETVIIGNQEWFAGNLRTTNYNDGTPIPNITDSIEWNYLASGAYAWYNNDAATYKDAYGALYNWYAVETGKLCPKGWRVPSHADWTTLTDYTGGISVAGGKLKSTRTEPDTQPRWDSPNTAATDKYGFSLLPNGRRSSSGGSFLSVGTHSYHWSSTEEGSFHNAWYWLFYYDKEFAGRYYVHKKFGFAVRCLRDI